MTMTIEQLFSYSKTAERKVEHYFRQVVDRDHIRYENFAKILCNVLKDEKAFNVLLEDGLSESDILFYLATAATIRTSNVANRRKEFRLAPDLLLLMANMAMTAVEDVGLDNLYVSNYNLFAPACLMVSTSTKWTIKLERAEDIPEKDHDNLIETLNRLMPHAKWENATSGIFKDSLLLSMNLDDLNPFPENLFKKADNVAGGVFLCSASCLGLQRYAHMREAWVKSGLLRTVVQTRPVRPWMRKIDPVLFELGAPSSASYVRMIQIGDPSPGEGDLDMRTCISLISSRSCKKGVSMDVPVKELVTQGQYILDPNYYLAGNLRVIAENGQTLRGKALVLRAQQQRTRIADEDSAISLEKGEMLAREISLYECEYATGFVDESRGNLVKLPFDENSQNAKYLLQKNDIIFAFRGTINSVGQTGFVANLTAPAVTGLSMCVIRVLPDADIDPVWLYYYLRSPEVLKYIRSQAFGSTLVNVNSGVLQDLPLVYPTRRELDKIHESHERLVANSAQIAKFQKANLQILNRMHLNVE